MSTATAPKFYTLEGDYLFFSAIKDAAGKSLAAKLDSVDTDDAFGEVVVSADDTTEIVKSLTWEKEKRENEARRLGQFIQQVQEQLQEQQ